MDKPQFEHINHPSGIAGAVASLIGGRGENQDSYLVVDTPSGLFVIVCDGMGGGPAGKTASLLASRTMGDYVANCPEDYDPARALEECVVAANAALIQAAIDNPTLKGMGTTCVALLIRGGKGYIVHVGDSRVYQLRGGRAVFRTADHSFVGECVRRGDMTEEEARNSNFSNVITKAIGGEPSIEPEVDIVDVKAGDRFALMSDGIWGAMPETQLVAALSQADPPAEIVNEVTISVDNMGLHKGGGHDNLTLALVEVTEDAQHTGLLTPATTEEEGWSISDPEDAVAGYVIEDEGPSTPPMPNRGPSRAPSAGPSSAAPKGAPGTGRTLADKVAEQQAAKMAAGQAGVGSQAPTASATPATPPPNIPTNGGGTDKSEKESPKKTDGANRWKPYFWVLAVALVGLIGWNVWSHFNSGPQSSTPEAHATGDSLSPQEAAEALLDNQQDNPQANGNPAPGNTQQSPNPSTQRTAPDSKKDPNALTDALNRIGQNDKNNPQPVKHDSDEGQKKDEAQKEDNRKDAPKIEHDNAEIANILNQLAALKQKYPDQFPRQGHEKEFQKRQESRKAQIAAIVQALNKYKQKVDTKKKSEVEKIVSGLKSSDVTLIDTNYAQPTGDAVKAVNRYMDLINKL